jgi:hypothetical protein
MSIERIRKLLVLAADPRTNACEAVTARREAMQLIGIGIVRREIDIADVLDVLPEELFDGRTP